MNKKNNYNNNNNISKKSIYKRYRKNREYNLFLWNIILGFLHGITFISILSLSIIYDNKLSLYYQVTTDFWSSTLNNNNGRPYIDSNLEPLISSSSSSSSSRFYNLLWVLVPFPLLTSLFHINNATLSFKKYIKYTLYYGVQYFRWIEYSITAGLMTWVIWSLSGGTNIFLGISLLIININMNILGGLVTEMLNSKTFIIEKILNNNNNNHNKHYIRYHHHNNNDDDDDDEEEDDNDDDDDDDDDYNNINIKKDDMNNNIDDYFTLIEWYNIIYNNYYYKYKKINSSSSSSSNNNNNNNNDNVIIWTIIIGFLNFLIIWSIILSYFFKSISSLSSNSNNNNNNNGVPWFVYTINIGLFIQFLLFGLIIVIHLYSKKRIISNIKMIMLKMNNANNVNNANNNNNSMSTLISLKEYKKKNYFTFIFADRYYYEILYQILSLVSKLYLTWFLFAGIVRTN